MRIYTIYVATNNVNGKQYVGFDSKWPKRKQSHKNEALNPKSLTYNTKFHNAIRKHGFDSFEWSPIYQSANRDHTIKQMERYFITEYDTFDNGYNLTLGGEGPLGWKMSDETKQKKSKALKGKPSCQSRQISTPHGIFDGLMMAANALGLNRRTITHRLQHATFPDWFYTDGKTMKIEMSTCPGSSRQISTPHGIFDSTAHCSRQTGIPVSTISDRILSIHFNDWYYTGIQSKPTQRQIITPHGHFPSIAQASKQLNVDRNTIAARVRSKRNVDWYFL